jgi:hypothetical protein
MQLPGCDEFLALLGDAFPNAFEFGEICIQFDELRDRLGKFADLASSISISAKAKGISPLELEEIG